MKENRTKIVCLVVTMIVTGLIAPAAYTQYLNQESSYAKFQVTSFFPDTLKTPGKAPTGAMIRSMIFPGWGQWYNKKKLKALVVFGAEVGLLGNSIYLNQKYVEWDRKFKASQPGLEQNIIISNREFYINNRNLSTWWLVGVILFSMADAFVDAHLANFDESSDLSGLNISPVGDANYTGIRLSIYWRD